MSQNVSTGTAQRRIRIPPSATDDTYTAHVNDPHAEYRARRSRKIVREFAFFVIALSTVAFVAFVVFWALGALGEVHWEEDTEGSNVIFPHTLKSWNKLIEAYNSSVVLVIYSEGCPSCKRMKAPFVKTARAMVDRPVMFVGVNANKHEFAPLFHQYGVEMVPTILFLNPKRTIFPYPGGANAKKIQAFVSNNLEKASKH